MGTSPAPPWAMMIRLGQALLVIGALSAGPAAFAREPGDVNDLAREVEDPVTNLSSISLQNEVDLGIGPNSRARNTLSILPTYGIPLTRDVGIVSRTKVPIVSEPNLTGASGYTSGLGDVTESLFVVPKVGASSGVLWGVGPTLLLPTATPSTIGAGKFGLGPVAAVLMQPKPWTFGVLAGQVWSIAGARDRPNISLLSVMPLGAFYFPGGWYVNTAPEIKANWNATTPRNRWTVPVGAGGGKVFLADTFPINVSVGAYWNAIRPDTAASPLATAQLQVALLFPH